MVEMQYQKDLSIMYIYKHLQVCPDLSAIKCTCILTFPFLNFIDIIISRNGIALCSIKLTDLEYAETKIIQVHGNAYNKSCLETS